jgi:hypothetical protein
LRELRDIGSPGSSYYLNVDCIEIEKPETELAFEAELGKGIRVIE